MFTPKLQVRDLTGSPQSHAGHNRFFRKSIPGHLHELKRDRLKVFRNANQADAGYNNAGIFRYTDDDRQAYILKVLKHRGSIAELNSAIWLHNQGIGAPVVGAYTVAADGVEYLGILMHEILGNPIILCTDSISTAIHDKDSPEARELNKRWSEQSDIDWGRIQNVFDHAIGNYLDFQVLFTEDGRLVVIDTGEFNAPYRMSNDYNHFKRLLNNFLAGVDIDPDIAEQLKALESLNL